MSVQLTDAQWSTCVLGAIRRLAKKKPPTAELWNAVAECRRLLPLVEIDGLPVPGIELGCCEFVHLVFARRSSYALFVSISPAIVRIQRFEGGTQSLLVETEGTHRVNLLRMYLDALRTP